MAKIFIDANIFIDWIEERRDINKDKLATHDLFISPLSIHILTYLYKYKMPNKNIKDSENYLEIVPFDKNITNKAISGPTKDFKDNVQLHSAATSDCDIFLTEDNYLLNLKFFGSMRIINKI